MDYTMMLDTFLHLDALDETVPSFREMVLRLLNGEMPFDAASVSEWIREALFHEIQTQKELMLQVLMIVLVTAIFGNLIRTFDNAQIAEISFYMISILIAVLLMRSFDSLNELVSKTCTSLSDFMELLLPPYVATVILSSGKITALGFYEITVLAIHWIQVLIIETVLPAVKIYMTFLVLNQMSKEDIFSKTASLIETAISWVLKMILGLTAGLQTVQCLTAPAVDHMKNSAMHRIAKNVPGVGSVLDSATETVAGAAIVLKNAVGMAGILILVFLCAAPVVKLMVCILMFRLLCAVVQPICEKRLTESIESTAKGAGLLLRTLMVSAGVFMISLAMILAFVYQR